eukprot:TRINITY_DN6203_c0_g1_i1.p1 TRINITY_DN6203_c0_g1~~TRINITY_DN6203_c0_g1_i1.p1  ORF type:complete len:229 (+),score=36.44 TRINITY_DN6203_c0_g1_i1:97-783(+)
MGEVIFFRTPPLDCTLLVAGDCVAEESSAQLFDIFSQFGLVFDTKVFGDRGLGNFAFVKYYSKNAAIRAHREANGLKVGGAPLKVKFAMPRSHRDAPLDISKSIELANYYIGFNMWCSSVVALLAVPSASGPDGGAGAWRSTYECIVRVTLADGRWVEARGQATSGAKDRVIAIEHAKKNALTDARKRAFQRLALVILASGKVAVHVLEPQPEPQPAAESSTESVLLQ